MARVAGAVAPPAVKRVKVYDDGTVTVRVAVPVATKRRVSAAVKARMALRALSRLRSGEVTFTCVPPGSGLRIGIDRDDDGILDGDE